MPTTPPAESGAAAASTAPAPATSTTTLKDDEDCGFCACVAFRVGGNERKKIAPTSFMRAGPCGGDFTAWEECVKIYQERGDDFALHCKPVTRLLTKCMLEHKEYYEVALPDATNEAVGGAAKNEE